MEFGTRLGGSGKEGACRGLSVPVSCEFVDPRRVKHVATPGDMTKHLRSGKRELTVIDAVIVAIVVAIVGATGIPLFENANRQAKTSTLLHNLHSLRAQIELYKLEHGSAPPALFEGGFPQLIRASNAKGEVGPPGSGYPYGPYLQTGVPLNPFSGRSVVTLTETFPPTAPSGNAGWLYHQQTGQIVPDQEGFLTE